MAPRYALHALLLVPLLAPGPVAGSAPRADDGGQSRERAALSEEQALLRRQLLQLTTSMESIAQRFESEGRAHAAQLLREGLRHVSERGEANARRTLEEVMQTAQQDLSQGQAVRALENQQAVLSELERLLAILLDRPDVEDLEQRLAELADLRRQLDDMAGAERSLRQDTRALREQARSEAQRSLERALEELAKEQRKLLAETEASGRESGALELEALERALAALARDQTTDLAVLQGWTPAERPTLEAAAEPLDGARRAEAEAARLARAAAELRRAARDLPRAADGQGVQGVARTLEEAAEREDLAARTSGDPTSAQTARALARSAEEARAAGLDAEARRAAAEGFEARAAELEAAAAERARAAAEGRDEAARGLAELAERDATGAGRAAQEARAALERAQAAQQGTPGDPRAMEETARALETLRRAAEEQGFLGQATSATQETQAQRSERLAENLAGPGPGRTPQGQAAREALERAAGAMREASQEAAQGQAPAAAERAAQALEALQEAQAALAEARTAQARSQGAEELAERQAALAAELAALQEDARVSALGPRAEGAVESALAQAREHMEQATAELGAGQNLAAAGQQRQALEQLSSAGRAADAGVEPQTPEDRARAEELAQRQAEIEKRLYDFAERYRERDQAKPLPSLARAQDAAQRARQSLEQGDLSGAEQQEQEAERAIEEAAAELAEEEDQYQRLRDEELLFRIAEEVAQLLAAHQALMAETLEADAAQQGARASRAVRLRLRRISGEEGALGKRALEVRRAIAEEGSNVFAEILGNVGDDLARIERDMGELGGYQSGARVQALQQDVEDNLRWLAEALEEEKDRRQQEQQEQQGGEQEQPGQNRLVPDVAELKLLRRLEREALDSLEELLVLNPELIESSARPDAVLLEDIMRLAHRHERTSDLFQQFRERLGLPDPFADQGEGEGTTPSDDEEPR